jgi:2-keto-3-deoxy-L-rhamnonate aldolase RhmA
VTLRAKARFEELITSGRRPTGSFIFLNDPSTSAIFGSAGFDWVVIDREHGAMDIPATVGHIRAAQATGAVPLVRVLENSPPLIQQALDLGAQGVIVPKVGSAEEAARAVAAGRYQPGGRGMCPVVPATDFTMDGWADYRASVNENALVIPLIETNAGVENIREICAVDGVDYVFFGLADLSQDLGIDMIGDASILVSKWEEVAAAAREHSVRVGAPLGYGFDRLADWGSLSGDADLLRTAAGQLLAASRAGEGAEK